MSLNIVIPDTFNGPLGLLHSLIVRDEIDIYDIPIARLTASYCEEIAKMAVIDIDEGAEFLDLASRLKDIKLRMLLPPEELPGEDGDEDDAFDPRAGLVEALLEYRRFKDAARLLGELAEEQARRFPRVAPKMRFRVVEEDSGEDRDGLGLFLAMQSMLERLSAPEVIESHEIPIATRISQIQEVLSQRGTTRFSLLLSSRPDRKEMVAFFVAVLELVRRGELTARQTESFSDIILEKREPRSLPGVSARSKRTRPVPVFPPAMPRARRAGSRKAGAKPVSRPVTAAFPPAVTMKGGGRRPVPAGRRVPAPFPAPVAAGRRKK